MKSCTSKEKPSILLIISFIIPICTYASTIFLVLAIYNDVIFDYVGIDFFRELFFLTGYLLLASFVFFIVCLAFLKDKEVPLYKKLIAAGLNTSALLFAGYILASHF